MPDPTLTIPRCPKCGESLRLDGIKAVLLFNTEGWFATASCECGTGHSPLSATPIAAMLAAITDHKQQEQS